MLKKKLNTPWKRVTFLLLFLTVVALLAVIIIPPPLEVRQIEEWRDTPPGQNVQRTIQRVVSSCADTAIGGKPFAHDYWIVVSANDRSNPYSEIVTLDLVEKDEQPTQVDVTAEDLELVRTRLRTGKSTCIRQYCATRLNTETFEKILSSCSANISQSLHLSRVVDWDQHQIEQRLPLVLSLSGLAILLVVLSLFYTPTIGRLVSWIKDG